MVPVDPTDSRIGILEKKTHDGMMKAISLNAKTSKIHKYQRIEATCVTAPQEEGYTPNNITSVTGHQNTHSLIHYCDQPPEHTLSNTLL